LKLLISTVFQGYCGFKAALKSQDMINFPKLFIVFIILSLVPIYSCHKKQIKCEKETYLLPNDFKGIILVFFNQSDGAPAEYEDSARLYKIPKSGLLKTQHKQNGGCASDNRIQFFYLDSIGNRKPIKYFMNIENEKVPLAENFVMLSFLSNKNDSTHFVIHLVGEIKNFVELTNAVRKIQPIEILKCMNHTE